jgi:hypothetical protein
MLPNLTVAADQMELLVLCKPELRRLPLSLDLGWLA